eukprot:2684185-Pyramimonas_sp.AAC.2
MSRPEHIAPPEIFYNDTEAKKYARNSRMMEIQVGVHTISLSDLSCELRIRKRAGSLGFDLDDLDERLN